MTMVVVVDWYVALEFIPLGVVYEEVYESLVHTNLCNFI